jgi:TolB-like protein
MAPEQAADSRGVTAAADIYSLGAILYHLLAGRPPICGETPMEVLLRAGKQTPKRIRMTNRNVPRDLETICLKCLDTEPASRYSSTAALVYDLERFCAGRTILARRAGLTKRAWRWTCRNPLATGLAITAAASLVAAGFFVLPPQAHTAPPPTIAVLPFEAARGNPENAYLAAGIHENVIADLSHVAALRVIGHRSVAQYASGQHDAAEIGRALRVSHVVEGSVDRAGDRIRIRVRLSDAHSKAQLWAQDYNRAASDLLMVQHQIAEAVVNELNTQLSGEEKHALAQLPTTDLQAYDLYLRARSLMDTFSFIPKRQDENRPKAIKLLQEAIARDPNFVRAYCFLGELQATPLWAEELTREQLAQAKGTLETALRIRPDSGEAHLALGRLYYDEFGWSALSASSKIADKERGAEEFREAARFLPNSADVLSALAAVAEEHGQWQEALRCRRKAVQLEPRDPKPALPLADLYTDLRKYDELELLLAECIATVPQQLTDALWRRKTALAVARGDTKAALDALEANPARNSGLQGYNIVLARVLMMERRFDEAIALIESIPEMAQKHDVLPRSGVNHFAQGSDHGHLGVAARAKGDLDKARRAFEVCRDELTAWLQQRPEEPEALARIAIAEAGLGRKDEAVRTIERATEIWPLTREPLRSASVATHAAVVYAWLGDRDRAIAQLQAVVTRAGGPSAGELRLDPRWDELRNDPRFYKIIAEAAKPIELD